MNNETLNLITSNDNYHVRLHRTSKTSDLDKLMQTGLVHDGDIGCNTTSQSQNPIEALGTYQSGGAYGQAVLVFHFPRTEWDAEHSRLRSNIGASKLFHYVTQGNNISIHPRHVIGWLDKENDDQFHPNPYPLPREPSSRNPQMEEILLG